jgi:hypothetical protein
MADSVCIRSPVAQRHSSRTFGFYACLVIHNPIQMLA